MMTTKIKLPVTLMRGERVKELLSIKKGYAA